MSISGTAIKEVVDQQISRFSGLGFSWLSFPEELEDRFEAETAEARCVRLWVVTLIGIVFYNLVLVARYICSTGGFIRPLVVRMLIVTPIALAVSFRVRRGPGNIFREASIAVVACLAGLTNLYLASGRELVISAYAQLTVLSISLFATIAARLRFPYAAAVAITMLLGDVVFLRCDRFLPHNLKFFGLALCTALVLLTVLANYNFGREERLNYLLQLRSDLLVQDLNRLNASLRQRSEIDALTGLANRHCFDQHYAKLWRESFAAQTVLSVVMVDVDHFKSLNDRHGHLYGDKVLKRIATLLEQALRMKSDFVARFGGEEFVVLLPEADEESAMQVAERLRLIVGLAGFPALDPSFGRHDATIRATVSCGVATTVPDSPEGREYLLEAADTALYRAKAAGRNCVRRASAKSRMNSLQKLRVI